MFRLLAKTEGHAPGFVRPSSYYRHDLNMLGNRMRRFLHFLRGEDGPTSVEYAVMLALIIIVCIAAVTTVGGEVFNMWGNNGSELGNVFGP